MISKVINIFLIIGFLTLLPKTPLSSQGPGGATFDINSGTLIVDTEGNYVDFSTFINLNPGRDYSDLMPEFDDNGNLTLIKIKLLKPLIVKKKEEPKVVSVPVKKTNTTPSSSSESKPIVVNKHTPTPKVEEKTEKKKKFRFTTASELKGLQAPYFSEKDVNGVAHSTSSLYGKVVVIKFWFLKCSPCLEEIPELNKLVDKYKSNTDVKFIAPATDDFEAVKKFMGKKNFKYTILADSYNIHGDFKVAGYPTHIIIYKNGLVGKVLTGKNSRIVDALSNAIDEALMLESDDKSMTEIPQPLYSTDKVFRAEEGTPLSKEEYLNKLASGRYRVYEKVKTNDSKEIFLRKMF